MRILLILLLLWSCQVTEKKIKYNRHTDYPDYATGFYVEKYPDFKILVVKNAYPGAPVYKYILTEKPRKLPDSLSLYTVIEIPVNHLIVTSTTHLPALEMLDATDRLLAFPNTDYVSSTVFRKLIDEGKVKEVGKAGHLDTETVLSLQPDLIVAFSSGSETRQLRVFEKNIIPVLYNADWRENTPLGRAEWIKVFGYLLGKENEAAQIFDSIVYKYKIIKNSVKTKNKPKPLVFQGGLFGDKWFVPGGNSYAAHLIRDAQAEYVWNNNSDTGSFPVNFENVLLKMPQIDIWLNPGMFQNKQELLKKIPAIKDFKVYKNNKIYTYNLKRGVTGGVLYFEQSNAHPDWVLEDLYHIFYPFENQNYSFHFYTVLPD